MRIICYCTVTVLRLLGFLVAATLAKNIILPPGNHEQKLLLCPNEFLPFDVKLSAAPSDELKISLSSFNTDLCALTFSPSHLVFTRDGRTKQTFKLKPGANISDCERSYVTYEVSGKSQSEFPQKGALTSSLHILDDHKISADGFFPANSTQFLASLTICPAVGNKRKVPVTVIAHSDHSTSFLNTSGGKLKQATVQFPIGRSTGFVHPWTEVVGRHSMTFSVNAQDYFMLNKSLQFVKRGSFDIRKSPDNLKVGQWSQPVNVTVQGRPTVNVTLTPHSDQATIHPPQLVFSELKGNLTQEFRIRATDLAPFGSSGITVKYDVSGPDALAYMKPPIQLVRVQGMLHGPGCSMKQPIVVEGRSGKTAINLLLSVSPKEYMVVKISVLPANSTSSSVSVQPEQVGFSNNGVLNSTFHIVGEALDGHPKLYHLIFSWPQDEVYGRSHFILPPSEVCSIQVAAPNPMPTPAPNPNHSNSARVWETVVILLGVVSVLMAVVFRAGAGNDRCVKASKLYDGDAPNVAQNDDDGKWIVKSDRIRKLSSRQQHPQGPLRREGCGASDSDFRARQLRNSVESYSSEEEFLNRSADALVERVDVHGACTSISQPLIPPRPHNARTWGKTEAGKSGKLAKLFGFGGGSGVAKSEVEDATGNQKGSIPVPSCSRADVDAHAGADEERTLFGSMTGFDSSETETWHIYLDELDLCEEVGTGASAQVYRGYYFGREVAIKRLFCSVWEESKFEEFFRNEAQLLATLHHPNVIRFYGAAFSASENRGFLVTEFAQRGSLAMHIARNTSEVGKDRFFDVTTAISHGMQFFHAKGVVHRDLKPDNVLLDENSHVKLCDFGLSRFVQDSLNNTMTAGIGTPAFMAIELIVGQESSVAAGTAVDVFSFGILMWVLWTHRIPYDELKLTPFTLMQKVVHGLRPKLPDDMPALLQALVESCWADSAAERPPFSDIIERLQTISQVVSSHSHDTLRVS